MPCFFNQLLLPFCDPSQSGIEDDPQESYYVQIQKFTNSYAADSNVCGLYGHMFGIVKLQELIHGDGILIQDAVKGGTNRRIHMRWVPGTLFDEPSLLAMNHSRFLQIKRVLKLNDNRDSPGRADEGYDPAYKFDLIYSTMVNKINTITKYADLNVCMDETLYAVGGYGKQILGKSAKFWVSPIATEEVKSAWL